MFSRIVFSILLLLISSTSVAAETVHEFMLDNGLKVLVKEDHRAPVAVAQIWYKVGSSYEHDGITGVSHVLEHMMFKGTKKHAAGEFSRIISENGGRENAFTSRDYTAYFQRLEKSRLPVSFELEADRMHNLILKDEEFTKEVNVVMEERRLRTEDKPTSLAYERFIEAAYQTSPYQHPVIGWMNDLQSMKPDDLADWYRAWYVPNNAVLVVAGDVDPKQVLKWAKKYYGVIPKGKPRELKPRTEVAQKGMRRITVKAPAELPYIFMGYKTPSLKTVSQDWEAYALEVAAYILDGGNSSRFARELVRGQQIAAGVSASYDLYSRLQTLFVIGGTPAKGKTIPQLELALRAQIQRLKEQPVDKAELHRIKAQVVASNVYERDSIFYQAMQMGELEAVGLGWQRTDEYVDRVKAVTAEQIQAVAKKYLHDDVLTIAELDPQPLDQESSPQRASAGGAHGH
jgi:zinc protease